MGNPKAFLTIKRKEAGYRPVHERVADFGEVEQTLSEEDRVLQASRCMDCGVPFCHWSCPLGNRQPEWQDLVYKGEWRKAYENLQQTDDFPEFTGRICPALCEKGCVLNLTGEPVTVRENEVAIIEKAYAEGYVQPVIVPENGKKVAVIGSGPAGLACANQLSQKGYRVTVFERDKTPGGLLRFGIPDFKLNKKVIDRRISLMERQRVEFVCEREVREDTGSDCVGTAIRQGARSVTQIEIMPKPPEGTNPDTPWPGYPRILKTSSSHQEGCVCRWSLTTHKFIGKFGHITGVEVKSTENDKMEIIEAEMVLLAMGFVHPDCRGIAESANLTLDDRRNISADDTMRTSAPPIFVAGDAASGASLVVRAIASGRKAAESIDGFLKK